MLDVQVTGDELHFGASVTLRFMRTLRIPDDGREYPLPPGFGSFPIYRVGDYAHRLPGSWRQRGGVLIPMYQREAMWIDLSGRWWKPSAVKIGFGGINVVSGETWDDGLSADPQGYVVVPEQPSLDGINTGHGFIRQFVAAPLDVGRAIGDERTGWGEAERLQVMVFEPKPGLFADKPPMDDEPASSLDRCHSPILSETGPGTGERMGPRIHPDEYGQGTWDLGNHGGIEVYVLNSRMFQDITGLKPPPTPISADTYAEVGLPWFDLYDEGPGDSVPAPRPVRVKSVSDMETRRGRGAKLGPGPQLHPDPAANARKRDLNRRRKGGW